MLREDIDEITFADLSKFKKKEKIPAFPLVRVVGQQSMNRALFLTGSNPSIGNLLLMGEAGTGKGTAAKGLGAILPDMDVVTGCEYNCDPENKGNLCIKCTETGKKGGTETSTRPVPLLELPIGASEKRIFGGFDHKSRFKPGIVGRANRGYLLVERVNLLDPDILGRLLTVAETGMNRHEADGREFVHPANFVIIATMNPEDGELENEVMDHFGMVVKVKGIKDIEERIEIVRRVEAYKENPDDFVAKSQREMVAFRKRVKNSRDNMKRADVPKKVVTTINKVVKKVDLDNDRVKDALREAALANAVFNDRLWVTVDDVAEVAEMVLGHRAGH